MQISATNLRVKNDQKLGYKAHLVITKIEDF